MKVLDTNDSLRRLVFIWLVEVESLTNRESRSMKAGNIGSPRPLIEYWECEATLTISLISSFSDFGMITVGFVCSTSTAMGNEISPSDLHGPLSLSVVSTMAGSSPVLTFNTVELL